MRRPAAVSNKLQRDAKIKIAPARLMSAKWLGRRAARNGLHHRRLHFDEAALVQEIAHLPMIWLRRRKTFFTRHWPSNPDSVGDTGFPYRPARAIFRAGGRMAFAK